MNSFRVRFPFSPLSQNNIERTGIKTRIRYKTKEAKEYKQQIHATLSTLPTLKKYFSEFDPENHGIKVAYEYHIQKSQCLTKATKNKASRISARGGDCGNFEKYTTDCIFEFYKLNDYFITELTQVKVPTKEESFFYFWVKIFDLDTDPFYGPMINSGLTHQ